MSKLINDKLLILSNFSNICDISVTFVVSKESIFNTFNFSQFLNNEFIVITFDVFKSDKFIIFNFSQFENIFKISCKFGEFVFGKDTSVKL